VRGRGGLGELAPAAGGPPVDRAATAVTIAPPFNEAPPRLLARWLQTGRPADLAEHARQYRRPATDSGAEIIRAVTAAGLRGRGGAWFPTGRKMQAVATHGAAAGAAYVVVNAAESEPASSKDQLLLQAAPHLVLDGAELAAVAVGARQVSVCLTRGAEGMAELRTAIAERRAAGWHRAGVSITAVGTPRWYTSSDATALARFIGGGPAKPQALATHVRGVRGKPTMVSNAETFAHIALIARYGARWFREVGTSDAPGTWLVTLSGAVVRPGVYEVPVGASAADIIALAGGASEPWQAMLLGGYCGSWLPAEAMLDRPLAPEALAAAGVAPGVGILIGLPANACGLAETARVVTWLAGQSARQCGPCFNGLPAVAEELAALTWHRDRRALSRARFDLAMVYQRGGCAYPNGTVALTESALRVFADDVRRHLAGGGCDWVTRAPTLPLPEPLPAGEPWR